MFRYAAIAILSLTVVPAPAFAADEAAGSASLANIPLQRVAADAGRPAALPFLYSSFIALQAFDAYSTTTGLSRGATEGNVMMRGIAGNTLVFWGVKAGATAATILITERMWKKNRVGAIVTMVAVNSMMASVAARNAGVLRQVR